MARIHSAVVGTMAALALAACSDFHGDPAAGVFLYGRVTDTAGASVVGASVLFANTRDATCATVAAGGGFVTDSAGDYYWGFFEFGSPHTECIKVVVVPPQGTPLLPDSVIRQAVPFTSNIDSVRIDFRLRPSA
jgi:hypothetical protein